MAANGRAHILLSFSCFMLFLMGRCFSQSDKLVQGQLLKDGEEMISANGKFLLNFFQPFVSRRSYLGIWYNRPSPSVFGHDDEKYSTEQPVWIANRNHPTIDNSGILTIDRTDGNLKISHNGGRPIEVSSVQAAGNTSAVLMDSGNLVLQEMNSNGSVKRVLWQSFDYPTDTLLPGMKLGINLQTGHRWSLRSWINKYSPAAGSYTLDMDSNVSNQLIIRYRGQVLGSLLWLNGHFNFSASNVSGGVPIEAYNFSYTSNEQEKYFSYSVDEHYESLPFLNVVSDGSLLYENGFALSCRSLGSCENDKIPICRNGVPLLLIHFGMMSGDGFKFKENENMTLEECGAKCMNNCSCAAFANTNEDVHTGCQIWSRGAKPIDYNESVVNSHIYILEPEENKWWRKLIIAGIHALLLLILLSSSCYLTWRKYRAKEEKWWLPLVIAVGIALVIPVFCYLCYSTGRKLRAIVACRINRRKLLRELGDNISLVNRDGRGRIQERDQSMNYELRIFDFQTIIDATDNFSAVHKLGEGGFGQVYKGQLPKGQKIAIKRLSRTSGQGIMEFKNEVKLIAKLQHTNLVRLLGCSLQGEERILAYEYMSNKSLDYFIFDSNRKKLLNWNKRFKIIEGMAQGLLYLHKYSRLRVIHRDLKASNILLDDQMNPKISDFGMARIFEINESEANTNRIVGTYGYMSPEYVIRGVVSEKTDVFSFGVVLLEIVSGKKNNTFHHAESSLNLIGYTWQLWNEGKVLEVLDPTLIESCSPGEVLRCLHVSLLCVQDQANDRPRMSDVVFMLTNETMVLPAPKQPAFFINENSGDLEAPEIGSENCSINDVTISEMIVR